MEPIRMRKNEDCVFFGLALEDHHLESSKHDAVQHPSPLESSVDVLSRVHLSAVEGCTTWVTAAMKLMLDREWVVNQVISCNNQLSINNSHG